MLGRTTTATLRATAIAATMLLGACGGAGSESGSVGGGASSGDATSLAPAVDLDEQDYRHFLSRTHFGIRTQELARLNAIGLEAYVDEMLDFGGSGAEGAEQRAAALLVNEDDPVGLEGAFPSHKGLARWWVEIMMHTEHPFREELAFFWHDHFAVSSAPLSKFKRAWMKDYIELFRSQGTGNLRDLLIAVSRDSAMADWLNQTGNDQFNINENYAREFWELFTLGVDNGYTHSDIRESAEAHTGLKVVNDEFTKLSRVEFVPADHADGSKLILGGVVAGQSGGGLEHDDIEAVVDITLAHVGPEGGVAEFISRKLVAHYVNPQPSNELVQSLANVMRTSGYELKPVLKTLFLSRAFFAPQAKEGIVKNPLEAALGFVRSTEMVMEPKFMDWGLQDARQRPTQPPDVNGWVKGEELLSAVSLLECSNLAVDAVKARDLQAQSGLDLTRLVPAPDARSFEVVQHLALLLGVELSPREVDLLAEFLDTRPRSNGTIEASEFNAADPQHLDERLRGLLTILVQHPTYLFK